MTTNATTNDAPTTTDDDVTTDPTITTLVDAMAAVFTAYRDDATTDPTDAIGVVVDAYRAATDGNAAAATVRTVTGGWVADNPPTADPVAFGAAAMAGARITAAVSGSRGRPARDAVPTIVDVTDARVMALVDAIDALVTVDGVTVETSPFASSIRDAITNATVWNDDDRVTTTRDTDPRFTAATTRALDGITDAPRGGSGGGARRTRDYDAITGTDYPVTFTYDDVTHHATITTPTGDHGDITVTTDDDVTYGSLSAWSTDVAGSNRNGWTSTRPAHDDTITMDDVCPAV